MSQDLVLQEFQWSASWFPELQQWDIHQVCVSLVWQVIPHSLQSQLFCQQRWVPLIFTQNNNFSFLCSCQTLKFYLEGWLNPCGHRPCSSQTRLTILLHMLCKKNKILSAASSSQHQPKPQRYCWFSTARIAKINMTWWVFE